MTETDGLGSDVRPAGLREEVNSRPTAGDSGPGKRICVQRGKRKETRKPFAARELHHPLGGRSERKIEEEEDGRREAAYQEYNPPFGIFSKPCSRDLNDSNYPVLISGCHPRIPLTLGQAATAASDTGRSCHLPVLGLLPELAATPILNGMAVFTASLLQVMFSGRILALCPQILLSKARASRDLLYGEGMEAPGARWGLCLVIAGGE